MNWLKIGVLPLVIAAVLQGTALAAAAHSTVKLNSEHMPEWSAKVSSYGGKLLLSDSPETVPGDGIMYQDTITGDVRLFFHHVNGTKEAKKIVVLLENAADQPVDVTVLKYGLGGPGFDYLEVGKKVQRDYLNKGDVYLIEVPARGSKSLISSLDTSIVEPNMLVNGMYDFKTDGPVTVKVMMMPVEADVQKFAAQAKVLPADEYRLRGTFEGKDRLIVGNQSYDAKKNGSVAITLADNVIDRYVVGVDATDGTRTLNYGNYGIVYNLYMPTVSGEKVSYYLNPRGGEYAGWLGMEYRHQDNYTIPTPGDTQSFGSGKISESTYLGTYESGKAMWLTFSPPGASNLPIRIIIAPSK